MFFCQINKLIRNPSVLIPRTGDCPKDFISAPTGRGYSEVSLHKALVCSTITVADPIPPSLCKLRRTSHNLPRASCLIHNLLVDNMLYYIQCTRSAIPQSGTSTTRLHVLPKKLADELYTSTAEQLNCSY